MPLRAARTAGSWGSRAGAGWWRTAWPAGRPARRRPAAAAPPSGPACPRDLRRVRGHRVGLHGHRQDRAVRGGDAAPLGGHGDAVQPLALGQGPVPRPVQALQLNEPARDQRQGEPGAEQADAQPPGGAGRAGCRRGARRRPRTGRHASAGPPGRPGPGPPVAGQPGPLARPRSAVPGRAPPGRGARPWASRSRARARPGPRAAGRGRVPAAGSRIPGAGPRVPGAAPPGREPPAWASGSSAAGRRAPAPGQGPHAGRWSLAVQAGLPRLRARAARRARARPAGARPGIAGPAAARPPRPGAAWRAHRAARTLPAVPPASARSCHGVYPGHDRAPPARVSGSRSIWPFLRSRKCSSAGSRMPSWLRPRPRAPSATPPGRSAPGAPGLCWTSVTFSCCSWVIWYDPVSRMVLISSRQSSPPPSRPTTRKTNGVREDRATPAAAALGRRRGELPGPVAGPAGRGWPAGRAGRPGAAGRGRGPDRRSGRGRRRRRPGAPRPGRRGTARGPAPPLCAPAHGVTTSVCPLTMSPSRHGPPRGAVPCAAPARPRPARLQSAA